MPDTGKNSGWLSHGNADALLQVICLDAEFRGKAIADKLLEEFVGNCFENDYDVISLSVAIDNVRAIAFYRKSGWQVVSRNNEYVCMSFKNVK